MQIKTLLRDIVISIKFLQEQLDNIDNYLDKSLIFQNPDIIESWIKLARSAEELDEGYDPEYVKDWLQRTETYVGYLLSMRMIHLLFNGIQCGYLDLMKNIINYYNDWEKKEFIKADIIEVLPDSKNLENLKEEITKDYEELNCRLLKARSEEQEMLLHIFHYLMGIMDRVNQILMNFVPSIDDFAKAIDKDLREWTHNFGDDMFKEMKEDLNRNYKEYRTAPYTPELWGRMLDADEEALKMAKVQQLAECNAPKQEHWGEDMKKKMDDNGKLMSQIYSLCHTDDLFDLSNAENLKTILRLLKPDNLSMFYDIIVRRSLIQCEMFPELKTQHDKWLKGNVGSTEECGENSPVFGLSNELSTEEAMKYWKGLKQKQFVDDNYQLLESTTRQQAAYIAELFSEKLNIKTKWKTFEDVWGIKNLAQEKNQRLEIGKNPSRSNEIDDIFEE
jgi:hypothetical protein